MVNQNQNVDVFKYQIYIYINVKSTFMFINVVLYFKLIFFSLMGIKYSSFYNIVDDKMYVLKYRHSSQLLSQMSHEQNIILLIRIKKCQSYSLTIKKNFFNLKSY